MEIPDNVENLGTMVFMKCTGLREIILPQYIKEISEGLFFQCTQLENITLPQYVETLGKDAFTNCSNMDKISLPDALRCIKKYEFLSSGLERIKIPPGVIELESGAFRGCIIRVGRAKKYNSRCYFDYITTCHIPTVQFHIY